MSFIYSVATWNPVHAPCCSSTWRNKGHEKYRTRVAGVFFSKEKAEEHAKKHGKGYFVERHKILDSIDYVGLGEAI